MRVETARTARRRGTVVPALVGTILVFSAALALPPRAAAIPERVLDADSWVGREVILKALPTPLRNEKQLINPQYIYQRYRVEKAEGDSILIAAGNTRGWVGKDKAVLFHRAINYFSREIRHYPVSQELYNLRGLVWRDKRQPEKAFEDFSQAILLSPRDAWLYSNRGIVLTELKRYDEALEDYTQAIRLRPDFFSAFNNRGLVWAAKKDYDKAIADYTEAIRIDPTHMLPFTNRGHAWRFKKEYDKAIADYDEAIRLNPKAPLVYTNRGLAHVAKKEFDEALADYDEAIRVDPKDALGYNNRAWIWATCPDSKVRDGLKAMESATRACELSNWRSPMSLDTLAAAHAEVGDFGAAMKWQAKSIGLLPKDSPIVEGYRDRLRLYEDLTPYREVKPEE